MTARAEPIRRLVVTVVAAFAATACGADAIVEQWCMVRSDACGEQLNDAQFDECVIEEESNVEIASIYDCEELYLQLLECRVEEEDCSDSQCLGAFSNYSDCRDESLENEVQIDHDS